MTRRRLALTLAALMAAATALRPTPAGAQSHDGFGVQGFGMAGITLFSAAETFEAVLGESRGPIFGGGLRATTPLGPYLEVGAWRFAGDGERVFVGPGDEVFPLGIPTTVTMRTLEVTAGWRFRRLLGERVTPHLGGGLTSLRYEETSDFAGDGEDVAERFRGFHLTGGAEVRLHRWIALAGDVTWTSIADALDGGAAAQFGEDNLGGTSFRVRILLGR